MADFDESRGSGGGNSGESGFLRSAWRSTRVRAVFAVLGLGLLLFFGLPYVNDAIFDSSAPDTFTMTVLKYGSPVMLILFIELFTRPLPTTEQANNSNNVPPTLTSVNDLIRLKRYWMMFAYAFMVLALIAAVYPFTLDFKKEPYEAQYAEQVSNTLDSPISIFRGCIVDENPTARELACYPDGDDQPPRLSWVLQAGRNRSWSKQLRVSRPWRDSAISRAKISVGLSTSCSG